MEPLTLEQFLEYVKVAAYYLFLERQKNSQFNGSSFSKMEILFRREFGRWPTKHEMAEEDWNYAKWAVAQRHFLLGDIFFRTPRPEVRGTHFFTTKCYN